MILEVRVIPRAKLNRIEEIGNNSLKAHLSAPARDDKANKALREMLAKHYQVKKKQVFIVRGERSQNKVVEVKLKEDV